MLFHNANINLPLLRQNAFNLRWAEVETGVIPLTAADPDFRVAQPITDAIQDYTKKGYFNYGPTKGLPQLKSSLAIYFNEKRSVQIHSENILPVDSAAFGIYLTCKTILSPGDEAIIFDPVDFLFRYSIEQVGGKAVPFSIPPNCTNIDFDCLENLITPKTKLICICNPLNPTGKVFTKNELMSFATIAIKHNLIIISDEIWSDIVFSPFNFTSIASLNEDISKRTITVTGFSKSYGLAGLRIGALLTANDDLFNKIYNSSLHQSTIHGVNVISQVAATAALEECESWLKEFVAHLHEMRNLCINRINEINGFSCVAPEGCYVAFIDIKNTQLTSQDMHSFLLKNAKVAVVPGLQEWFGKNADGYIRISFATSKEILNEAFDRIQQSIHRL